MTERVRSGRGPTVRDHTPSGLTFAARQSARAYLTVLVTLGAIALLLAPVHWRGFVVGTGSMLPRLHPGDVVVTSPFRATDGRVPVRAMMVLHNPARPGTHDEYLVHRVVRRSADGRYRTRGDANRSADSTLATPDAFVGRARLRLPWIGLPVVWYRHRQWGPLLLFVVTTAAAAWLALPSRRPPRGVDQGSAPRSARGHPSGRRPDRMGAVATVAVVVVAGIAGPVGAAFTSVSASSSNTWTAFGTPLSAYDAAVVADAPSTYLRVDDLAGDDAWDTSGHGIRGDYGGTVDHGRAGAVPSGPSRSVCLGPAGRIVTGGGALADPTTFTLEVWFTTTSAAGGEIVGFTDTRGQPSTTGDRYVTMDAGGHLTYGAWGPGSRRTITTPLAYNDGAWHLLTLTATPAGAQEATVLYVDGAAVASGRTSRVAAYSGWWRFGAGTLDPGPGIPAGPDFDGCLDDGAVFHTVLSATRVSAHFAAR